MKKKGQNMPLWLNKMVFGSVELHRLGGWPVNSAECSSPAKKSVIKYDLLTAQCF
jgi:hypothetical protein